MMSLIKTAGYKMTALTVVFLQVSNTIYLFFLFFFFFFFFPVPLAISIGPIMLPPFDSPLRWLFGATCLRVHVYNMWICNYGFDCLMIIIIMFVCNAFHNVLTANNIRCPRHLLYVHNKIVLTSFHIVSGTAPPCLSELLHLYSPFQLSLLSLGY